jgi:hypothetical protein
MSKEDRQRPKAERVAKRDERIASAKADSGKAKEQHAEGTAQFREDAARTGAEWREAKAHLRETLSEAKQQYRQDMAKVREDRAKLGATWNDMRNELGMGRGIFARMARGVAFDTLRVTVHEHADGAYVTAGALGGSRRLGPLKGARAEFTDGARVHRVVGGAVGALALGPAGALIGLSTKAKATALVIFEDGTIHQHKLDGNIMVRRGQVEAARFNVAARSLD